MRDRDRNKGLRTRVIVANCINMRRKVGRVYKNGQPLNNGQNVPLLVQIFLHPLQNIFDFLLLLSCCV